ncbi:MAG: cadmium-translocating P-type ATPase, partial [Clostridiales bacterium]|nr:cadmium-translocating P-type ATPase [Clostridiales bacterium]
SSANDSRGCHSGASESCGCHSGASESCGCHGHVNEGRGHVARLAAGAALLALGVAFQHLTSASAYLALAVFASGYILLGWDVVFIAAKNIARGRVFDENFLMAIATVGAFCIGEYAEAVGVMLFYQMGEHFQGLAVRKSRKTIASLMDVRPDYANIPVGGELVRVAPETVAIGDVIVVKPGEKVPLDGVVAGGSALLDLSALTGEPVPRKVAEGDAVLSGCVNTNGLLTVEVTQAFGESAASRIVRLVESAAEKKAPTENFITKFARYYTPVVVCLAALIALAGPIAFGGAWSDWLNRGLIFLVISCPCALVISIPLGFFGGIGLASKRGILVKGGNYLEALGNLDIVVLDKTGTLTRGVFEVTEVHPANGFGREELLETAAKAEAYSSHPIAASIMREHGKAVDKGELAGYSETAGHGVSVWAGGEEVIVGNEKLMHDKGIVFEEQTGTGTKAYVASGGVYRGYIVIADEAKPDSANAIAALKKNGVRKTVMLTGDGPLAASAAACQLQIDEAYGGLLPWEKVEKVESLGMEKRPNGALAFVGDGINDAPALAMADVGVAMGGLGTDAAIEAADVVLMTDEPSKLAEAVEIARFTKRVVWQNIVFALGVKAVFLLLGAFGAANMWEAVFADVGVALLAILNAARVISKENN